MSDSISAPPAEPATRAPAAARISGLPPTHPQRTDTPVFGFILLGGPLSGALVRDVRLANELAQRGYPVHVWWVMERRRSAQLHQSITERWLFNGMRYLRLVNSRGRTGSRLLTVTRPILDALGRLISRTFSDKRRSHFLQRRPWVLQRIMGDLLLHVCDGIDRDPQLIRRFARQLDDAGVTHLLPMLAALCPWADAAAKRMRQPAGFLVTFQGYELYANYARALGCERPLYDRFIELVDRSDWPAVAVSPDYVDRVVNDIGVARDKIQAIPPGVPIPPPLTRDEAKRQIATAFKTYRPDLPLLTFVGRCDTEKGIDLLLYATAILRQRGIDVQLAICGPTLFGTEYRHVCRQIAENLRCPVFWHRHIADEQRAALFAASDCVVYPSIHREPFGMVPVEAMSYGTPAVVPDYGGVAGVIEAEGKIAGVRFRVWDSGDLADQIQSLLQDRTRWQQLADAAPHVARYYSVANLADRILAHLNLPVKR
ncbi:MAG: glycosyltransferase family 4 protein [Phycisphaeraceae bacterium]